MGMKKKEINYQLLIRRICLIVLDIICIIAASILALLTRFEFDFSQIPKEFLKVIYKYGPFTIVITLIIFSINSCLYASISSKTSVFIGFSRPFFLFLSPTTPFLHHFTFNYTFSRTFPFPRTACPLLRGNTSPLSFVMCHVPKVSVMFWGSCHIRLLL